MGPPQAPTKVARRWTGGACRSEDGDPGASVNGPDPERADPERGPRLDEARFAAPPGAGAEPGSITVGPGRADVAARRVQAACVAVVLAWALVASGVGRHDPWLALAGLALAIGVGWEIASRARAPRRTLRWDGWGLTEELRGARTSIAWASARAWVARDRDRIVVRIVDDAGRSIACGWGGELPHWARGSVGRRDDVESLLAVAGTLPRADPPALDRRALPYAPTVLAALAVAVAIAIGPVSTGGLIAAAVVIAVAVAPDLPRARQLVRRAWALRGARTVVLAPGPALALARPDGGAIPLVSDEASRDARLGDRGEPARATLTDTRDGDPYRVRAAAHATRIESLRERRARRHELAWITARAGLGVAAMVVLAAASVPPLPPPRRAEQPPMPSLAGPRPPQPTAWRSPPRAPILHRGVRATCESPGVGCYPAVTYFDEVGREVYRCGSWQVRACDRELREALPDAVLAED